MAVFTPIDPNKIKVGDPVTKELLDFIKNNFDNLDERVSTLGEGSGRVSLINEDFQIGVGGTFTGVLFYEVMQDCIATEASIQLFAKAPATTGSLIVDIKKNSTTNPSGFNTIFSTPPTINIAAASDYTRQTGTIDPAKQTLTVGTILRVDITGLPVGLEKFRLNLMGEF